MPTVSVLLRVSSAIAFMFKLLLRQPWPSFSDLKRRKKTYYVKLSYLCWPAYKGREVCVAVHLAVPKSFWKYVDMRQAAAVKS